MFRTLYGLGERFGCCCLQIRIIHAKQHTLTSIWKGLGVKNLLINHMVRLVFHFVSNVMTSKVGIIQDVSVLVEFSNLGTLVGKFYPTIVAITFTS